MCTVVVRWSSGEPAQVLALRDELVGRDFDDPGRWWPELPSVVGGRDRAAGGSWCVTEVASATTALVLNRPQRRIAAPGAPSRGVLPLLAVEHGRDWPAHVVLPGMASFALVLVQPGAVQLWVFDGATLTTEQLPPGTHMVTSGGAEDGKAARYLQGFREGGDWLDLVTAAGPADDPAALVVRHEGEGAVYATVFGQVVDATPGALSVRSSRTPWLRQSWTTSEWH